MKETLLRWLACPACGATPRLQVFATEPEDASSPGAGEDVVEGVLTCACGAAYPVVDGVPRMLQGALLAHAAFRARWESALRSAGALGERALAPASPEFRALVAPTMERFGREWGAHPLDGATWGLDQATRLDHALRYLGWTPDEARGRVVLDAGCGTAKLTCGMAAWGGEVVGLDLNLSVVRGWRERRRFAGERSGHVHVVQGDVLQPPFRPGSFDGVHSAGVLHHTPDTRAAFFAVARLVRPGGSFGVWLYDPRHEGRVPWFPFVRARWASVSATPLRRFTPSLPAPLLHGALLAYSAAFHVLYVAAAALRGRRHGQTIRERTTSLFDTLAPPYVHHHTPDEVSLWFAEAGFEAVRDTSLPDEAIGFCLTGRR